LRFKCKKADIYNIVNQAYGFTSTRSIETILQNILIKADSSLDNKIYFKTSNIITGYSGFLETTIENPGETTISAKKLLDIIRELPENSEILFNYDGTRLNISSEKSIFTLSTLEPVHFPTMTDIAAEYYLKIDSEILLQTLKKVYFCIANEASKISYNGVHFKVLGDKLQLSASDFQRIAIAEVTLNRDQSDEFIINIPKKTIGELIKVLGDGYVEIETDKKQVIFKNNNITIYSNLIESYIKSLNKLFEVEHNIKVVMPTSKLYESVKRISTITSEINYGIIFSFHNDTVSLNSMETEYGMGVEAINGVKKEGEDIDIIFNAKLLLEILSHIDTEFFNIYIVGKRNPVIIEPINNGYRYLMVTISIENY
jgi:DNA polymerase-3 subunit beta